MIPCQNCTNLHKDFKLPTDLKSIHVVKTITVIEGSDTKLSTNELDPPDQNEITGREDSIAKIDDNVDNIEIINTSLEEFEDHQIMKRAARQTNHTRKSHAEPLIRWREFEKVKHPIKREIPTNKNSTRVRKRVFKLKPVDSKTKEDRINEEKINEEDKRKATELLEEIKMESIAKSNKSNDAKNLTELESGTLTTRDQNGTEAQLMTQAIIRKPNGKKVLLQDKAYSEPIRKNVKFEDFDRTDRAFKTNVNFYDDLPEFRSHGSSYESDSSHYKRPRGSSYDPDSSYKHFPDSFDTYPKHRHHASFDNPPHYKSPSLDTFDEHYPKYSPHGHSGYDSYSKYKPSHNTHSHYDDDYPKHKSRSKPMTNMIDVMPDHDAQYELVPMEKDEDGNAKIKQHRPSSHRGKYNSGGYDRRPHSPSSSYDSDEDRPGRGGYGYKPYYSQNKHNDYYSRPSNSHNSYKSSRPHYNEDKYPKYEKVPREHDYDTHGYGSEETRAYQGRTSHASGKQRDKPVTLKVNIDDEDDDEESEENQETRDYDYASRDNYAGRVASRVTKVPKTLEEYHKLHRTWEKRPAKAKQTKSHREEDDQPRRKPSRPTPAKPKQSPRRFPPSRTVIDKPHVSYEFEGPNSHVSMDFVTPKTPSYDEHSERFRDGSAESDESEESPRSRPRPHPYKPSTDHDIDPFFDKLNDASFKHLTTEKPYKITRLAGKPLYSGEDSQEFSSIVRDITPKLNQRDKEDLYNKLKHEVKHKKYKHPAPRDDDDIFKELGFDFNTKSKRENYKTNHEPERSKPVLIPKLGEYHDNEESGPRRSWNPQRQTSTNNSNKFYKD